MKLKIVIYKDPLFQVIFCISKYHSKKGTEYLSKMEISAHSLILLGIVFRDSFIGLVLRKDLVSYRIPLLKHTFNFTVLEEGEWGRMRVSDSTSWLKILQVLTCQFPATELMILLKQHLLRKAQNYIDQTKTSYR